MKKLLAAGCAAVPLMLLAGAAQAQDRDPCRAGMVCASDPATVMLAMEKVELKPRLSTDDHGDPMIDSDEAPYGFSVLFYGCERNRNCDSLRFEVQFRKGPDNRLELVNKWNAGHRFVYASLMPDGRIVAAYDVPTIGGATSRNFADSLDWWISSLEEMALFFRAELAPDTAGK